MCFIQEVQEMADVFSIKIDDYASNSYTSIKTILYANGMDVLILLFISFIVMLIYVISRNKENAVKALLGFSKHKIVLSHRIGFCTSGYYRKYHSL